MKCFNHFFQAYSSFRSCSMITGLVLLLLLGVGGCKSKSNNQSPASYDGNGGEIGITDFGGIKTIDEVSDTRVQLSWDYHPQAAYYVIYYKDAAAARFKVATVVPQGQTTAVINGLTINTSYSFKMHVYDELWRIDDNTVTKDVQTTLAPLRPSSVMLKDPVSSPGFVNVPTFTVRYVKPGETVRIFKDASCTQQIGSGVVAAEKNSIDLQSSTLTAATYNVYANTTNIYGHTSPCSTAYASYVLTVCPDDSYVPVNGNADYGCGSFCVFKTEAKNNGYNVPVAQYEETPWVSVRTSGAKSGCRGISVAQGYVDLISNDEWMVIARDIEATAANWSGGEVGNGTLNRGHSDSNPGNSLSISDPTDPWDQTGQDSSTWTQKRTHVLSNGEIIWDFAGNANEWVDWERGGDSFSLGPQTCESAWKSPLRFECEDLAPLAYQPANPAGLTIEQYDASNTNTGGVYGGVGGAAIRGGHAKYGIDAGVFSLHLGSANNSFYSTVGFRCVWRPE